MVWSFCVPPVDTGGYHYYFPQFFDYGFAVTTPLTFNLMVSMLSSPSLSTTFTAANGKAVKIWQWDFNYSETEGFRPTVLFNKDGKVSKVFSSGEYVIAVRATDENGIETTETLKIVVNGKVKMKK